MSWQYFKQTYLVKFWSPVPAVIAAGILSTYYFGITGTFWSSPASSRAGVGNCYNWLGYIPKSGVTLNSFIWTAHRSPASMG